MDLGSLSSPLERRRDEEPAQLVSVFEEAVGIGRRHPDAESREGLERPSLPLAVRVALPFAALSR